MYLISHVLSINDNHCVLFPLFTFIYLPYFALYALGFSFAGTESRNL